MRQTTKTTLFPYTTLFRSKKEKPLPPIKPEEIPFEIPENWVWCRLGEIIQYTENLDIQKYLSPEDRKSTRLNSSHVKISYAVFCLKKKKICRLKHKIYISS